MIPGGVKFEHVLFSLKTFAAGMLAYWLALRSGLDNPYWALGTVYIVMTPLAGALSSKALYRLAGTTLGAVVIVVLIPRFAAMPALLCVLVALWCGFCLFMSRLDHSPRSYVFMLAGYTVTLSGFTLVSDPMNSFHLAVTRVEEIGIGILCAAIVGRIIQPREAGPLLAQRVEGWLGDAADLSRAVLAGEAESTSARTEAHRLAAAASAIRQMSADVRHEGDATRPLLQRMQALQYRMIKLLPLLAEIDDLLSQCNEDTHTTLVAPVARWLDLADEDAVTQGDEILTALDQEIRHGTDTAQSWADLVRLRLARRLRNLVEVWLDCRVLRSDLATGETHALRHVLSAGYRRLRPGHTDYAMALRSALALVVVILATCAFWIYSGWPYGAGVVQISSILCSVLAMMDNPLPALKKILPLMLLAFMLALFYQFAVLPMLDGFVALAAAMGLLLIPCGVLLSTPGTWFTGFQVGVNFIYMMTFSSQVHMNFSPFIAAGIASFLGVAAAGIVMATLRAVSAEHSAARLLRAGWDVVIETASGARRVDRELLTGRMIDRLAQVVPRLSMLPARSPVLEGDILRDLRVGLVASRLRSDVQGLAPRDRIAVMAVLDRLVAQYAQRRAGADSPATTSADSASLLGVIDSALQGLLHGQTPASQRARNALVGLRSAIYPQAIPPVLGVAGQSLEECVQ